MVVNKDIKKIIDNCRIRDIEISHDVQLKTLLTYRPEGIASTVLLVNSLQSLKEIFSFLLANKINFFVIGGGSNTLINDKNSDFLIIRLGRFFNNISFLKNGSISCGAAFKTGRFVTECLKRNYDFSFLSGIPGTIGGAVAGNAGTGEDSVCKFIESLEYLKLESGRIVFETYRLEEKDYGYRFLDIKNLLAITAVIFKKENTEKGIIFKKICENIKYKKKVQPLDKFTAGCFFKNPPDSVKSAAGLIDALGFKGFKYGGAGVSEKHANFIENFHCATPADIYNLSKIIYGSVKENFNIKLENEVKLIGF